MNFADTLGIIAAEVDMRYSSFGISSVGTGIIIGRSEIMFAGMGNIPGKIPRNSEVALSFNQVFKKDDAIHGPHHPQ